MGTRHQTLEAPELFDATVRGAFVSDFEHRVIQLFVAHDGELSEDAWIQSTIGVFAGDLGATDTPTIVTVAGAIVGAIGIRFAGSESRRTDLTDVAHFIDLTRLFIAHTVFAAVQPEFKMVAGTAVRYRTGR